MDSVVLKIDTSTYVPNQIGKQSLGYVFGAIEKQTRDGQPNMYISRNDGFLGISNLKGNELNNL